MALIIDGYNLMHAAGIVGRGVGPGSLERSRLAVLNFLAESIDPAELGSTTVVFDAQNAPPGLPPALSHRGVGVLFAKGYANADELIEDLIARDNTPRRLVVVSSDHRLHRAARRRKAQAIDSDVWYELTIAARRARQKASGAEAPKPSPPFARSEVEYWLQRFADPAAEKPAAAAQQYLAPATDAAPSDQNQPDAVLDEAAAEDAGDPIFPREYLESIEREFED